MSIRHSFRRTTPPTLLHRLPLEHASLIRRSAATRAAVPIPPIVPEQGGSSGKNGDSVGIQLRAHPDRSTR
jgi:hypothetical protein